MRLLGLEIRRAVRSNDPENTLPLRQRVQRLEITLSELQELHSALSAAHAKLRNQFHGSKGGRPPSSTSDTVSSLVDIPHGDKASLRLALGLRPGRPFTPGEH